MATRTTKSTTTKRKSTTTKVTKPTASESPVETTTMPEPKLVSASDAVVAQADLKKKELIELVVTRSGIKKKDAKPVIEAMLAVLGETIEGGRELNLQPFGKLRINRSIEKSNGRVIICKLRQSKPGGGAATEPLAGTAE